MEDSSEKGSFAKKASSHASKLFSFIGKHAAIFALLAVLILHFVPNGEGTYPWGGINMRMMGSTLPFADSAAQSSVDNFLRQQASVAAAQQYPNLPDANRAKLIDDLVAKLRTQAGDQLETQRAQLSQQIKSHFQYEENGQTYNYMPDIDPYFYLRYARNIVEKGHSYDTIKDGVPWDTHMFAPLGINADPSWHQYVFAALYWGMSLFGSTTVMQAAMYFPIVFMLFSFVFAFLIANRLSGPVGGFFAALILGLLPAMTGRTLFGHADTDAYQVFFPLLAVWLLVEALSTKDRRIQIALAGLTGAVLAVYGRFWSGWWYLFDFVVIALVAAFAVEFLLHAKRHHVKTVLQNAHLKKFAWVLGSVLVSSAVVGTVVLGFAAFFESAFGAALNFTTIKAASHASLWPNVYTTVAELNPSSIQAVIGAVGGSLMFAIGLLGIALLLLKFDEHKKLDAAQITYAVLLGVWFLGTMYASIKGIRFILLIGPAFAVAFGAATGLLYTTVSNFAQKHLNVSKKITGVVLILIFGFVIMGPIQSGPHLVRSSYVEATQDVPIVNDAWWSVLSKIREQSREDAIVNSWWDFGHHFKYISDRAVTSDGAVQNSPQAHWIGKVLQTTNEKEAVDILRMLDCGANSAQGALFNETNDSYRSIMLTKQIIGLDRSGAEALLTKEGLSEEVLKYTHCSPPENFLITSQDMTGKAGVWAHFGLWDFARAEVWQKWRLLPEGEAVPQMMSRFNWSQEDAEGIHRAANALESEDAANAWISPWPGILVEPSGCTRDATSISCGTITIELATKKVEVRVSQGTALAGELVTFDKFGNFTRENLNGSTSQNLAVVLYPNGEGISGLVATRELATSLYVRLFYMDGLGLKHFDKFAEENQLFGGKIIAWNVSWAGHAPNIPDALKPKTEVVTGAQVSLDYIGWTDDDTVFDSSIMNWQALNVTKDTTIPTVGTRPLELNFGVNPRLVQGFESRVAGMKANQTKIIRIPPAEAYGIDPAAHALGNKTLNFKVKVVSVQ